MISASHMKFLCRNIWFYINFDEPIGGINQTSIMTELRMIVSLRSLTIRGKSLTASVTSLGTLGFIGTNIKYL